MSHHQHPPERREPRRRRTHSSQAGSSSQSVSRRWTFNPDGTQAKLTEGVVQEYFSCYRGLTWVKLRGYLENKWPGWNFTETKIRDYWVFDAPGHLTEEDRSNIAAMRDANRQRRPSVSDSE
ncbi:hypothetical protein BGZ61DRAFT_478578 [Ilyonectria robusta]|uniref:uncharacterized protein n=1 Tax=Ilyonectria robusta TaxID=1079257 RepID=UPI001E8D834E|nr:uncharacterized protein BGZ61DRAFT_478578 [Ilyonectria robusta]KAH8688245.1 hypothetical protein BGZ61DRAFT_478578 [Ilyonectria robusta]